MIEQKLENSIFYTLENDALYCLKEKFIHSSLSIKERQLLINEFLSEYLEFYSEKGELIGNTLQIEAMIDYLLLHNQ